MNLLFLLLVCRVVECLFFSPAGPKKECLSYWIGIRAIIYTSDVGLPIIIIRYEEHPLFGPAVDKNKPSTTRPDQCFFLDKNQLTFFLASHIVYNKCFPINHFVSL